MSDWTQTLAAGRLISKEKAPYFQSILHALVPTIVEGLGTIGVTSDGLLIIDPAFIAQVTPEQCAGLLVHEILHVTCGHTTEKRNAGRDRSYLGVAQDLAINPAVLDMGLQLPTGDLAPCLPDSTSFPKEDGFVRGLSADEYYDLLLKKAEKQSKGGRGSKGQSEGAGGAGGKGKPDSPNGKQGEGGQGGDDDHDHAGDGEAHNGDPQLPKKPSAGQGWCGSCGAKPLPKEPKGKQAEAAGARTSQEMTRVLRATAEAVRDHAQRSDQRGRMPAMLSRWADDLLKPAQIPWNQKLKHACRAAVSWATGAVDHRYDGISRRQAGLGFGMGAPILPRLRMPRPNVDVIGDTSGSMGPKEIGNVCSETMGIMKATNANVRFAACDAAAHGLKKLNGPQDLIDALVGGGGTDMRPAFDLLMKQRPKPEVIVCITDGLVGDGFPTDPIPGVKVIIVLVGPSAKPIPNTEWATTIIVPPGGKIEEHAA